MNALRLTAHSILAAIAVTGGVVACTSEARRQILIVLFEEEPTSTVDSGNVVVRRPRRPPPAPPQPTPTPTSLVGADLTVFRSWDDVLLRLPKNHAGDPDWARALEQEFISPQPGIEADTETAEILDLDVELTSPSAGAMSVLFSHRAHTQWLSCDNCHPEIFAMDSAAIDPGEIHTEDRCGVCHGKVAFDIVNGCTLCHLSQLPRDANDRIDWSGALASHRIAPGIGPRSSAAPLLDLDIEYPAAAQPAFRAVFSHATHTQWLACANCHPRLFSKDAGELHGVDLHSPGRCGACHGPVAFGQTGGCQRCHPAFAAARHHHNSLDLDVAIQRRPGVVFSHEIHTPWVECASCHVGLYETALATEGTTAADFYTGQYCAQCHGDIGLDLVARCQPCHAAGEDS